MRILIVDDEQMISDIYKTLLTKAGYEVIVEPEGEQGLFRMKTWHPDLVLLDLNMPKMTGYEVLEARMKDSELMIIPVIVLSGMDEATAMDKATALGANDYFNKVKVEIAPLLKKIERLVPKKGG